MTPGIVKTELKEILHLRNLFLQENNFQIRYNAYHERGWTDTYAIIYNGETIGYGASKGDAGHDDCNTIFEIYIIPPFRSLLSISFLALLHFSKATYIECQTNDLLLTPLMYQYGVNIHSNVMLFEDRYTTEIKVNTALFRKRNDNDAYFEHKSEPAGDYVLEIDKKIVGTGGLLLHYNKPFADLYMEVEEDYRRKGLGSFLIQELKKQCYLAGRVPAARCNIDNAASKATLIKAGLKIAGFMLSGQVPSKYFK